MRPATFRSRSFAAWNSSRWRAALLLERKRRNNVADTGVIAFPEIAAVAPLAQGEEHPGLASVQGFLERFGYLTSQNVQPGKLDDQTANALQKFQEFNGLSPTG